MARNITWLHISDLHTNNPKHGWEYDIVTDQLLLDLHVMENDHNLIPDFIFFTGDAAFGQRSNKAGENLSDQYIHFAKFLDSVRTSFTKNVPKKNIFIVPGNHDVNIKKHGQGLIAWLGSKPRPTMDMISDVIHKGVDLWPQFMEKLSEYQKFLSEHGYEHLIQDNDDGMRKPDRGIYCITRKMHEINIGIAGLNSAWSSAGKGTEELGKLRLGGERQFGFLYPTLKNADLKIALIHHPINWFASDENPSFEDMLASRFNFLLHGHEHANRVKPIDNFNLIGAGACYEHDSKESGYNFVRLNLDDFTGEVWLRRYEPTNGGKWVPFVSGDKIDNNGRRILDKSVSWLNKLRAYNKPLKKNEESQAQNGPYSPIYQNYQDYKKASLFEEISQRPDSIEIKHRKQTRRSQDEIVEQTEIIYQIPAKWATKTGFDGLPYIKEFKKAFGKSDAIVEKNEINKSFQNISGFPQLQLFRDQPRSDTDTTMVKAGLDTPSLQKIFIETSQHFKFLENYDPLKSYCFITREKTGKTSWLGFLANYLISNNKQSFEPIWVNTIPGEYDAYTLLTDALNLLKDQFNDNKPVLFIDNLHLQPGLILGITRLRASKSIWKDIPICSTYLLNPPEKESWRNAWEESQGIWPKISEYFEERRDFPCHIKVSDKEGELTEDGKILLNAFKFHLDKKKIDLLLPVFLEPQKEVPFAWLAFYIVENYSSTVSEAEQWIYEKRIKMAPEKLYQISWNGSERHQDILRACAFLGTTSKGLLIKFCSVLREESEELIEIALNRIIEFGDLWEKEENWPFTEEKTHYLNMQEGLMTLALILENFSKATENRYKDTLLNCISPSSKIGERASILALAFAKSDKVFNNRLSKIFINSDYSAGSELFLSCTCKYIMDFNSSEKVLDFAEKMILKSPKRLRTQWASALIVVFNELKSEDNKTMINSFSDKIISTLEQDWKEEIETSKAGLDLAEFYMSEENWASAISWFKEVTKRSKNKIDEAEIGLINCLLKTGKTKEAEEKSKKLDETAELLFVWAEHFEEISNWDEAIASYKKIAEKDEKQHADSFEKIGDLYRDKFDPPRIDEAAEAYEQSFKVDSSSDSPLMGLATLFENTGQWEKAIEVWVRICSSFDQHQGIVEVRIVRCLLKAGKIKEAEEKSKKLDETAGLLFVWAEHFEEISNWDEAIASYKKIAEKDEKQHADSFKKIGNLYRDKFDPPRIDEAAEAYEQSFKVDSSRVSPLMGLATLFENTEQWEKAIEVHKRIGSSFDQYQGIAEVRIVRCLLKAGKIKEAEEKSRKLDETAELLIVWAEYFEEISNWDEAIAHHLKIAEKEEKYRASAFEKIGDLYQDKFDPPRIEEATEAYEQSFEADSSRVSPLIGLATLFEKTGLWEKAVELWVRIGSTFDQHKNAADAKIVQCLLKAGKIKEAEEKSKKLDETAELLIVWAEYFEEISNWDEAIAHHLKIAKKEEKYRASTFEKIGVLYRDKFDPPRIDEAAEAYEQSFEADSSRVSPLIGLATLFEKTGLWEKAVDVHERIGSTFDQYKNAADAKIVQCLLKAGKIKEAEENSKKLDETADLLAVWAEYFEEKEQWEKAVEVWRKFLRNFKDINSKIGLVIALDIIGKYVESDKISNQINIFEELNSSSDEISALANRRIAFLYLRKNQVIEVLNIVDLLKGSNEECRALLLASICYHDKEKNDFVLKSIKDSNPKIIDILWIKQIAIGYFNRYSPNKLKPFLKLLLNYSEVS